MKIILLWSKIAGFFHICRPYCALPYCPSPSKCMRSIHFLQLFFRFSVAESPVESIRRTVKGLPYKRSARAQIYGGAGLSKLIMTSSGRASPWAFGELKGRKRIEMLGRGLPSSQPPPANHVGESRQSGLQRAIGNRRFSVARSRHSSTHVCPCLYSPPSEGKNLSDSVREFRPIY